MKKYLFIVIISIQAFSQNVEMTNNMNKIDWDFIPNENIKTKLIENSLEKNSDLIVYAEKYNDSIFSIYILNNTKDSINLSRQDSHLYIIQEAMNKKNEWKPIEYWRYSWCGNSYSTKKMSSQEIIKTETVAYNGNFETEIRFKLLNNSKVYYSNALKGKVFNEQFIINDSIKKHTGYSRKFTGGKTTEKMIFLEPDGAKEFGEKNKKWTKWVVRKNKKRNKEAG